MTFTEYYKQVYLPKHSKWQTKACHMLGVAVTIAFVVACVLSGSYLLLIAAPFVVYPFAWSSHALFERNKPAAFRNPVWAKLADLRMCWELLTFRIPWEQPKVTKCCRARCR